MALASAPQVAVTTDAQHYAIKRMRAICTLYKQLYNESITTDKMADEIAKRLTLNANTVKTLLSQYRRAGWQAPKCTRKPRNGGITQKDLTLNFEELNAQWGK